MAQGARAALDVARRQVELDVDAVCVAPSAPCKRVDDAADLGGEGGEECRAVLGVRGVCQGGTGGEEVRGLRPQGLVDARVAAGVLPGASVAVGLVGILLGRG